VARYRHYRQSGHPDVASQYSQGWFSLEDPDTTPKDFIGQVVRRMRREAHHAEGLGYSVELEYDLEQGYAEITCLLVCRAEDHDGMDCTCHEDMEAFDVDMGEEATS